MTDAAGLWDRIEFRPFLPAAGDLVGGTTWRQRADEPDQHCD
jgi:hypothetical protein